MGEILFLAHRVPWPPNRGDKIRSHHILRRLLELAPVHLGCFADDDTEAAQHSHFNFASKHIDIRSKPSWKAGLEALTQNQPVSLTSFHSSALTEFVRTTVSQRPIDCIFVFSGQMAQYVPKDFTGRIVVDFADVDSAKFESYGALDAGPMGWINRREGQKLAGFEKTIAERADHVLFVSEQEADLFAERSGISREKIISLENGIDLDFFYPATAPASAIPQGPTILFTGQMDYRPNIEAVTSFSQNVMPAILRTHPDARFKIVGRSPTLAVGKLAGNNATEVVGAVDDIRRWLKAASVVVAPLRIARGIQNKVLEAMAMGKAMVASSAAAEGIHAVDGEHLLVANDTAEEAELVCQLLADPAGAVELGQRARKLIVSRYGWDHQLARLPQLVGFETSNLVEAAE